MSGINTTQMRIAMQDENYRNVWLNGTTHFDGCEYTHYPCAVLKLCDEVDALRAELAAKDAELAKRKPIPVSERMPEYIEGKLNYVMLFDSIGGEWEIGRFVKLSNSRYQWSLETGIYWHDGDFARVTHWMPLPEPPEVNDGQAH